MLEALEESLASAPLTKEELDNYRLQPVDFITHFICDPWKPTKDQRRLLEDVAEGKVDRILLVCGRDTGKTKEMSWLFLWKTVCWPRTHARVVSGSFEQAINMFNFCRESILQNPRLRGMVESEKERTRTKKRLDEPQLTKVRFNNGSMISIAKASQKSVRGPHPDILGVDEAREVKTELWEAAKYMVMASKAPLIFITTSPPDYPTGFAYDLWCEAERWGYMKRNWSLADQPYLTDEAKARLEQIRIFKPEEYKREVLGQFGSMTGAVFSSEKILANRIDQIPPIIPAKSRAMGIDWGYNSPTAIIITQQGDFNQMNVIAAEAHQLEYYSDVQARIDQLAKAFRISVICADASHTGENQRLPRGVRVESVPFVSEKPGMIENTKHLVENDLLKIPRDFTTVIDQMIRYSWDPKVTDRPKVVKKDDHYVDALMLAVKGLTRPRWIDTGAGIEPQLGGELVTG
jgi:hypothetical protein